MRVADESCAETVETLVRALLVELEMAGRVEGDGADAAALAPDPERDRLSHRPARHEDGRFLAEELGDPALEALDALAAAVVVHPLVLAGPVCQSR